MGTVVFIVILMEKRLPFHPSFYQVQHIALVEIGSLVHQHHLSLWSSKVVIHPLLVLISNGIPMSVDEILPSSAAHNELSLAR